MLSIIAVTDRRFCPSMAFKYKDDKSRVQLLLDA